LPLLPWALILTLTPWGRGLVSGVLDAAQQRPSGSPSASTGKTPGPKSTAPTSLAPTGPRVVLDPSSGTVNTRITVTAAGFAASEKLTVYVGTRNVHTQTADATGAMVYRLTVGAGSATVVVKVAGNKGHTAEFPFRITPG